MLNLLVKSWIFLKRYHDYYDIKYTEQSLNYTKIYIMETYYPIKYTNHKFVIGCAQILGGGKKEKCYMINLKDLKYLHMV